MFGYEEEKVFSLRVFSHRNRINHVSLLLISNEQSSHYVLINQLDTLLHKQTTDANDRKWFFDHFLQGFTTRRILDEHKEL